MPIRRCKCGHPYYMHTGASTGRPTGSCNETVKNNKGTRTPCKCTDYDHDPASGKFG